MHTAADAMVIFGVTGDLSCKKLLPALYHVTPGGRLHGPVVGVAQEVHCGFRGHRDLVCGANIARRIPG
jgi:glucose-6-phosphate 1-dehydrogenase